MKFKLLLFVAFALIIIPLSAQRYTLSGYITDSETGEKLLNANVYDAETFKGSVSNTYGFYSLTLPKGSYTVEFSFIGYKTVKKQITLDKNQSLNLEMSSSIQLDEVVVKESRIGKQVESTRMSVTEVSIEAIKTMPVLLGEVDIIKTIQLLPGVQSGTEGSSGFYVRGGGPDQNLILLDGVPVYNASHLFGFFSVFNADAINSVTLVKGGFPARYGGRLSSVLDIRMKEGNTKKISGNASIGIISSKLTLEGPILSENTSFLLSARRTYIDILSRPVMAYIAAQNDANLSAGYYFQDFNLKLNHKLSDKHRLYLSAYTGKDKAYAKSKNSYSWESTNTEYEDNFDLHWGNLTSALRWNWQMSSKLFANITGTVSDYTMSTAMDFMSEDMNTNHITESSFTYNSGIRDYAGKIDFDYVPNTRHYIRFGGNLTEHTFKPGVQVLRASDSETPEYGIDTTMGNKNLIAQEYYGYFEDDIELTARLKTNVGVHISGFSVNGKDYQSIQPRASARFTLTQNWSLKAAYSQMTQYIHLLSNSSIGLPTDLWLPTTDSIKPQDAIQYAAGTAISFGEYNLSVEGYYKTMTNLIEYKEGASFMEVDTDWDDKIEIGKGWTYGAEIMLEKKAGKTTGWIGYTYAWAWRQFDNISFGEKFPYRYDRRHDLSIAITHRFTDDIDIGANWVFGTGYAVTLPIESYVPIHNVPAEAVNNGEVYWDNWGNIKHFDKRNNFRMPAYHRLDFGANFHKEIKWGKQTWSIGTYNAYNRKNPFYLDYAYNKRNKKVLMQYSLFPIIPSISYALKF